MKKIFIRLSQIMFRWVNFEDNYGREIIVGYLKQKKFKTVLDIGAGEGADLLNARKLNKKADFFAIENWRPNIDLLVDHGVSVYSGNIETMALPFKDNSVDVIICNQVLEHTKNVFWIMHEMTRVLKKNGRIIIGVPNLGALHNRIMLLLNLTPECIALNSAHLRGFTFSDLNHFLKIFPKYELVEKRGKGFYPFPSFIANFLSRLFPSLSWGIFVCYQKKGSYRGEYLAAASRLVGTDYYLGSAESLRKASIKEKVLAH